MMNNKKIVRSCAIILCVFLVFGCSKTGLNANNVGNADLDEGGKGKVNEGDIKSQLEDILKENNINREIVEYKQINNVEELAKKYPVLYEGLPNGVYEVRTKGFRLMVDIKERKVLKTFNDVSVSLG